MRIERTPRLVASTGVLFLSFLLSPLSYRAQSEPIPAPRPPTDAQRLKLQEADRLDRQADRLLAGFKTSKWAEGVKFMQSREARLAADLVQRKTQIEREVLGRRHPRVLESLEQLARTQDFAGRFDEARRTRDELVEFSIANHGKDHWRTLEQRLLRKHVDELERLKPIDRIKVFWAAQVEDMIASLRQRGEYDRAVSLARFSLTIRLRYLGREHLQLADTMHELGGLYQLMGDDGRAEPLLRDALTVRRRVLKNNHPWCGDSMTSLGGMYALQGDFSAAEPLLKKAIDVYRRTLGEEHSRYAHALNNLASFYLKQGRFQQAEALLRRALRVFEERVGKSHSDYALVLHNLATVAERQGRIAEAEKLLVRVDAIEREMLGENHPDRAPTLNNLAHVKQRLGRPSDARKFYDRALEIIAAAAGKAHPRYAGTLKNLAILDGNLGRSEDAWRNIREALDVVQANLSGAADVQSQRRQLAMSRDARHYLGAYLTAARTATATAEQIYQPLLRSKGALLLRQRQMRQAAAEPSLKKLAAELRQVSHRLANLSFIVPPPGRRDDWQRSVEQLGRLKDLLEGQLARRSRAFRELGRLQHLTPSQLKQAIPADAALVDVFDYRHTLGTSKDGRTLVQSRLLAFVVRRDRPIVIADLGLSQPAENAVRQWRAAILKKRGDLRGVVREPVAGSNDAAVPQLLLRRQLWEPLCKHLDGVQTVLISPDGPFNTVPLAALPSHKPGRYLIEDYAFVGVPIPQLLPRLLKRTNDLPRGTASIALIGDVDFAALAGRSSAGRQAARTRSGPRTSWKPLPGTQREIRALEVVFKRAFPKGHVQVLQKAEATEAALRGLTSHRYVHLATHGFFASPDVRNAASSESYRTSGDAEPVGFHPGLLSGIVLAGANRPLDPNRDDGILTAMEAAELDLRDVDLATLSACETGLGSTAGGEGLLGLQRSFQTAGAGSVLASLWAVDDEATRALMERFYANLWNKKLTKIEALREAQLWMLKRGRSSGVVPARKTDGKDTARVPPFYWAAFVLSGDWR